MIHSGLSLEDIQSIQAVLRQFPDIQNALLFGSRAKGNFKPASDVDIVLKGNVSLDTLSKVSNLLNNYVQIPYFFDVISYKAIENDNLRNHIDRVGISVYSLEKTNTDS